MLRVFYNVDTGTEKVEQNAAPLSPMADLSEWTHVYEIDMGDLTWIIIDGRIQFTVPRS